MELYRTITGQSTKSHSSQQIQPVSTQASSFGTSADPYRGQVNHLTPDQEAKLESFKNILQEKNLWSPGDDTSRPSHDDATLLRYLRARKFDLVGAISQFSETEQWMKEQHIIDLYENIDVEFYEHARLLYPQWTGHRDKRGIPVYVYPVKPLDTKNIASYTRESEKMKASMPYHKNSSTPAKMLPLFALYHNLLNFVLPLCTSLDRPNPEVPVTMSNNIVDISGVGLKQFWNLKSHMQEASVLATAHYPETLDRIFIIGAPSFFPTVWGWIKRWFDPVTVSKIFILGHHEVTSTLNKFIAREDIPKQYGGTLDWEWGQEPHMDAETQAAVEAGGVEGWVKGPCLWLDGQRVAVGSVNGRPRHTRGPPTMVDGHPNVVAQMNGLDKDGHALRAAKIANKIHVKHLSTEAAPHSPVENELTKTTSRPETSQSASSKLNAALSRQGSHLQAHNTRIERPGTARTNTDPRDPPPSYPGSPTTTKHEIAETDEHLHAPAPVATVDIKSEESPVAATKAEENPPIAEPLPPAPDPQGVQPKVVPTTELNAAPAPPPPATPVTLDSSKEKKHHLPHIHLHRHSKKDSTASAKSTTSTKNNDAKIAAKHAVAPPPTEAEHRAAGSDRTASASGTDSTLVGGISTPPADWKAVTNGDIALHSKVLRADTPATNGTTNLVAEKLGTNVLSHTTPIESRPQVERFFTAAEF